MFLTSGGFEGTEVKLSDIPVTKEQVTFKGVLELLVQSVWKYLKFPAIGILLAGAVSGLFQLAAPRLLQQIVDGLTHGTLSLSHGSLLAGLIGLFALIAAFFFVVAEKLSFYIATQVEDIWRYTALLKFYNLPLKWHDRHDSGEVGAKIDRGGGAIYEVIYEIFGQNLIVLFITLFFVIGYTLWAYPLFALIFIVPIPVYILVTKIISTRVVKAQIIINRLDHSASRTFYDGVGNLRYVKTFGKEKEETQAYADIWSKYHTLEYKQQKDRTLQSLLQKIIETLMRAVLLVVGIVAVKNHTLSIGELVLLISYQQLSFSPLEKLTSVFTRLGRVTKRASRLFDLAAETDALADVPDAVSLPLLYKEIRFENVHFEYSKRLHTMHDVSVCFKKGTTTAIVGRSGAGKTTLALLLLRFYDPDKGRITWDDIDLRSAQRASLRKRTALILQDTTLFNRTIAQNISYSNPHAGKKEVERAAKLAHAHEFITQLPKGYRSIVGERGVRLSGGQRQRIAIARSLMSNPDLLVMDEATSHLDSETELAIKEAIQYLHGKHTQVIIAHRLSTVKHADNIILMDKGRVLAQGNHKELLKHPMYKRLCNLQLQK